MRAGGGTAGGGREGGGRAGGVRVGGGRVEGVGAGGVRVGGVRVGGVRGVRVGDAQDSGRRAKACPRGGGEGAGQRRGEQGLEAGEGTWKGSGGVAWLHWGRVGVVGEAVSEGAGSVAGEGGGGGREDGGNLEGVRRNYQSGVWEESA